MIDITLCLSLNQRICAAGIILDKSGTFLRNAPLRYFRTKRSAFHETFAFAGKVAGLDRIEIV